MKQFSSKAKRESNTITKGEKMKNENSMMLNEKATNKEINMNEENKNTNEKETTMKQENTDKKGEELVMTEETNNNTENTKENTMKNEETNNSNTNTKENTMKNEEIKIGDDQITQIKETVITDTVKDGKQQEVEIIVNPEFLSGIDCEKMWAYAEKAALNQGAPDVKELDSYGSAIKGMLADVNLVVSTAGKFTVERYYHTGCLINTLAKRMEKKALNDWLKTLVDHIGQLEMFRQMRKIALMGQEALDRAILGKNRVLECYYMVKEMEELNKGKGKGNLSPQTVKELLRGLEGQHPFPNHAAMDQSDIDECRLHMDTIVTMFRLGAAFDNTPDICTFENAEKWANETGNSIEKGQAKIVADMFKNEQDKPTALAQWFDGGMKMPKRVKKDDETRWAEKAASLNSELDELLNNAEAIASMQDNNQCVNSIEELYTTLTKLRAKLNTPEETTVVEEAA